MSLIAQPDIVSVTNVSVHVITVVPVSSQMVIPGFPGLPEINNKLFVVAVQVKNWSFPEDVQGP